MVILSSETIDQLKARGCVRPNIEVMGYRVRFIEGEEGIPEKEVAAFKTFLKDVIPYLRTVIGTLQFMKEQIEKDERLGRKYMEEAFSPLIQLSHGSYHLRITWDPVIFIDREERIMIPESGGGYSYSLLSIAQFIGELEPIE